MKWLIAFVCVVLSCSLHAETWRFAVIGDTPYSDYERREMPNLLKAIADEHPALIVHAGDFKLSSARCSDELFLDRMNLFNSSSVPFIYTPGDNEWTDCKHLSAGRYDPLERLDRLRKLFFDKPASLGKVQIPVEQQSADAPENLRWQLGPVVFVSLNVPGPNNNFGMTAQPAAEFLSRNPILTDWLKQGFAKAKRDHAAGIVILMQANPGFKHFTAGLGHSGYRGLLEALQTETLDFAGHVLLVHGDTHWHRIDHPLYHPGSSEPIANFTRLETFGYPFMGWVKVIIDTETPTLFRFESHSYPEN